MTGRISALGLLLVGVWAFPGSLQAAKQCSQDWVCVKAAETAEYVDFYAENLQPYPVTVSLRVSRTRNLAAPKGKTATKTIGGDSRLSLLRLPKMANTREARFRYVFDWALGRLDPRHDDTYLYRLPYGKGKTYGVLQGYGSKFSHTGLEEFTIDFNMPTGTPVYAARKGVVARIEESHDIGCWESECGKYANFVMIQHSDGTTGEYYHLKRHGALVEQGDYVERGQLIAYSGNTGHTTMPHLHFGVYRASSWGKTESLPIQFETADGVLSKPRAGRRYRVK